MATDVRVPFGSVEYTRLSPVPVLPPMGSMVPFPSVAWVRRDCPTDVRSSSVPSAISSTGRTTYLSTSVGRRTQRWMRPHTVTGGILTSSSGAMYQPDVASYSVFSNVEEVKDVLMAWWSDEKFSRPGRSLRASPSKRQRPVNPLPRLPVSRPQ